MPATSLYRDQPSSVQGLKVSQWSYATYRFDVAGSYAVEVIDSGPSDSEPKLVVKKGAPPTARGGGGKKKTMSRKKLTLKAQAAVEKGREATFMSKLFLATGGALEEKLDLGVL